MIWPHILYFILVGIGLGLSLTKHGEPKTGEHNFFVDIFSYALGFTILYFGGFFNQLLK